MVGKSLKWLFENKKNYSVFVIYNRIMHHLNTVSSKGTLKYRFENLSIPSPSYENNMLKISH